jgi:hypothetical protein
MDEISPHSNLPDEGARPIAIVSQLLRNVATMHHIDEIFLWITSNIVRRLSVNSAQIWATQAYTRGAPHLKLRASRTGQPAGQAQKLAESGELGVFIERILREKRTILSLPVTTLFSQQQAAILAQQHYRYWTIYPLSKNTFLPPPQGETENGEVPTPLQIAFSFFTDQPLQSSQTRAISFLAEQSLRIAINHGLLLTTAQQQPSGSLPRQSEDAILSILVRLIPEHNQIEKIEQAQNPFSSAIILTEKKERRIYNYINGKKNIEELAALAHVNRKEIFEVVRSLSAQGYIRLRDAGGNLVDISLFV